ncbi:MAG: pyridoxamine 5'-phosphate oxidase family protein [Vitreoscilla sp.]|nr:pyridoxamine 5'-phosphate oxidase family protein [Polaromonas sp.]
MLSTPDAPTTTTSRADEPFPDHHNDLAATLKFAWQMVGRGVQDRRSAFHTPVLATQGADGPQARVLVLRAADVALRSLTFHTDTRSAKLPELANDGRVAVTFYDAARKVQLRLNGVASVHANDALSHQRWAASRPSSLRCYLGAQPGAISDAPTSGLPAQVEGREPELHELVVAEPNFAVLQIVVRRMEWLHLHTRGQRRALFTWVDGGEQGICTMQWLNP